MKKSHQLGFLSFRPNRPYLLFDTPAAGKIKRGVTYIAKMFESKLIKIGYSYPSTLFDIAHVMSILHSGFPNIVFVHRKKIDSLSVKVVARVICLFLET